MTSTDLAVLAGLLILALLPITIGAWWIFSSRDADREAAGDQA